MKKDMLQISKSRFMSIEKDLSLIAQKLLQNHNLKKLLFYTTPDALSKPILTQEQSRSLVNNNIKITPFVEIDNNMLNYVVIGFDDFTPDETNPEYRDNLIYIDIICHKSQWNLGDFQLRPFKIAGEIDGMLDKTYLTGIGKLQFLSGFILPSNDQIGGLTLIYSATHGSEDTQVKEKSNG